MALQDALRILRDESTIYSNFYKIEDQSSRDLAEQLKNSKISYFISLSNNEIGDQGAIDLAESLKDATVSHILDLSNNEIGDQGAIDLAESLKDALVSHSIRLDSNNIGDQGAIGLAAHLKDSTVSHDINLCANAIGAEGAIGLAEHLKFSKVSHDINLRANAIGPQGAIGLAEHLKDSKVSHAISLEHNNIGDQGIEDLANMITDSQFPSYIDIGDPTPELNEITHGNDAILAMKQPEQFFKMTEKRFGTKLAVFQGWRSKDSWPLPEEIITIITKHLGIQATNHLNLQSLQEERIKHIERSTEHKITPAQANYAIASIIEQAKLASNLDAVATLMLLTENAVNLLPEDTKKSIAEYVDIKQVQNGAEMILGLGASYIGYQSGANEWTLPSQRAAIFCSKGIIIDNLSTNLKTVTGIIEDYTYGYIGEKEQSLALEIAFGVGIGMLSSAPMMTIGIASLGGIRNYLDIEEQNIGKIGGGLLGFVGAYYAGVETYYQYAASTISSACVGDMLVGAKDIAEHGVDFMFNAEDTLVETCGDTLQDSTN